MFPKLKLQRKNCINLDNLSSTDSLNEVLREYKVDHTKSQFSERASPAQRSFFKQSFTSPKICKMKSAYKKKIIENMQKEAFTGNKGLQKDIMPVIRDSSRNFPNGATENRILTNRRRNKSSEFMNKYVNILVDFTIKWLP